MWNIGFRLLLLMVLLVDTRGNWEQPSRTYYPYQPHYEPYVPAPPGHTPRCAKPGQTFCETIDGYPQQLISTLLKNSTIFTKLLRDEDPNNVPRATVYNEGYEYHQPAGGYRSTEVTHFYPEPVVFVPPQYPSASQPPVVYHQPSKDTVEEGYKYSPPRSYRNQYFGSVDRRDSDWLSVAPPRSYRKNPLLKPSERSQKKRRAVGDTHVICDVYNRIIAPQTARNNKGDWKYVVNFFDPDEKYLQLINIDICRSDKCTAFCDLLTPCSECQCKQQFIQKRLIALEGDGNDLGNELFELPHGCSCQIVMIC